jgi:seryl-tRNA synthetase
MKHLATIQTEFLKEAFVKESRDWDNLTLEEQKNYLKKHPASKRKITAKPAQSLLSQLNTKREDLEQKPQEQQDPFNTIWYDPNQYIKQFNIDIGNITAETTDEELNNIKNTILDTLNTAPQIGGRKIAITGLQKYLLSKRDDLKPKSKKIEVPSNSTEKKLTKWLKSLPESYRKDITINDDHEVIINTKNQDVANLFEGWDVVDDSDPEQVLIRNDEAEYNE